MVQTCDRLRRSIGWLPRHPHQGCRGRPWRPGCRAGPQGPCARRMRLPLCQGHLGSVSDPHSLPAERCAPSPAVHHVEYHLHNALAPFLFTDEEPVSGDNPAEPAKRFASAEHKDRTQKSKDGLGVRSLRKLLVVLGTVTIGKFCPDPAKRDTLIPATANPNPVQDQGGFRPTEQSARLACRWWRVRCVVISLLAALALTRMSARSHAV